MSAVQPVAVYALRIPPGDVLIPAVPEFAAMFRVTMAAIDPSEEAEIEDVDADRKPRATLKIVRVSDDLLDDEDSEDDEDYEDDEDEGSSDEENGGPSTKKSKIQRLQEALAAEEDEDDDEDMDDDDEIDAAAEIKKIIQAAKGKGKAIEGESDDDDDDEEDLDSEDGIELDECVVCTLDPERNYQQPLDIVVNEGEKIFFKVSGTHTIHLTGNYVMPLDDDQSAYDEDEDEEDYDLSPDEDELDGLDALLNGDDESDELDDLEDPRVTEVASDEEVPKLSKGKNKRPAEESDDETADLDAIMAKSIKKDEASNVDAKKLSKADKKAAKKLKKNDGAAAQVEATEAKKEAHSNGDKKVQFAKDIIQGPTPSATPPAKKEDKKADKTDKKVDKKAAAAAADDKKSTTLSVREVQGVTVDDRKVGSGPPAKKGSKLEMRYIGKLENGKVFDSNKSGKPFSLKVGTGDVIKGWDIGLMGISAGGERRLTIPAHLAYGNKALPGIPKNSKLIFDVKCLSIK